MNATGLSEVAFWGKPTDLDRVCLMRILFLYYLERRCVYLGTASERSTAEHKRPWRWGMLNKMFEDGLCIYHTD